MDIREKLKRKRKKQNYIKIPLASIALVTLTLATVKLTGFSVPIKEKYMQTTYSTNISIADDGAIVCDSIMQGVSAIDLEDGDYILRVTGEDTNGLQETIDYEIELINYKQDMTYSLEDGETSKTVSLGNSTADERMLVVKYWGDLTIDSGVTLTATTRKKGMYIHVEGSTINNGTITMTARGAKAEGENVYLWKNSDGSFEFVPAVGGARGNQSSKGGDGTGRQTGGGAGGIVETVYGGKNGFGAAGTSYSGGSGGGGTTRGTATNAEANGGAGGKGGYYSKYVAGGGAGNPGGSGSASSGNGSTGTGGLLILYSNSLENNGEISSEGSKGGNGYAQGGASGGGSINIFAEMVEGTGIIDVQGGPAGTPIYVNGYSHLGTVGGTGTYTITKVNPYLNYIEKNLSLKINDTYIIDQTKLEYVKANNLVVEDVSLGQISYSSEDEEIVTVSSNGVIRANKIGTTKIKITDTTNNYSTYIYITVTEDIKPAIEEGNNFTIALKSNGTVWGYGLNNLGQLGNGTNDNSNEPVKLESVKNIIGIGTGYSHAIALSEDGEVYTWGDNSLNQLGNPSITNSNIPIKVEDLSNIKKVDAYKNISVALTEDGEVYIWGEDYSNIPMKLIIPEKVIDIDGKIALTEKGFVYLIDGTAEKIENVCDIAKISCGYDHELVLNTKGQVFGLGDNTQKELGANQNQIVLASDIYEIEAGNNNSMLKTNTNEILVSGLNTSGQLGTGNSTSLSKFTKIDIDTDSLIISLGEGTHSAIVDEDGFVWMTGINTKGELGTEDNVNLTSFTQIGDTIVSVNVDDVVYLDISEQVEIQSVLENTFNLMEDIVDDNQDNFSIKIPDYTKLSLDEKTITAMNYSKNEVIITHIATERTKSITISTVKKMEDLVKGIRDSNMSDGFYEIMIQDEIYSVELYNYTEDKRYSLDDGQTSKTITLGNDTADETMLIVKYHGNLTIDEGVTLTATTRKKGMYICVLGDIINKGEISMTARGAVAEGDNVYLWKNIDNTYEYVPEKGADGVPNSTKGADAVGRQTGGGAGGFVETYFGGKNGYGAAGTSYSGGSGGGGTTRGTATNGTANGGAGGKGGSYKDYIAGGGAGNPGGSGTTSVANGATGTGGLLILYADNLENNGEITSKGSKGGNGYAAGGSSGGGSINIFANFVTEIGNISAESKEIGQNIAQHSYLGHKGLEGGNGSSTINELGSVLNYAKKNITLEIDETYSIDISKITYTKLNDIQTEDLTVGNLKYEVIDNTIVSVDNTGKITGLTAGKTKIKITDLDNGYSTYIIVNVTNKDLVIPQVEEGLDYTVALKANGTVWSYGKNTNGQLGNNTQNDSNEPIAVLTENLEGLKEIVDIGVGDSSAIAVNKSGEVYTWGVYKYVDEEGTAKTENRLVATKETTLSNVVKVDSYKNNFYAVDNNGVAYIWGEGYTELTKIEAAVGIEDISGNILLGQDGLVYLVSNPSQRLEYLSNICEISCGEDHNLFLTLEDNIYAIGKNDAGQCRQWNVC